MSPVHISLILLSSVLHAFWNVLTRTSKNSQFFSGLKGAWILAIAILSLSWFDFEFFQSDVLFWAALSGVLHGLYILCLSRAYRTTDISYVYPIARSAPVFVPVFAFLFMGERLQLSTWLAIGIIIVAIYIIHFDGHLIAGFTNLFSAIRHQDLRWAFYTLALVVAYSLVDKQGMEVFYLNFPDQSFANGIIFFFLESLVGFSLCIAYLFLAHPKQEILALWRLEWKLGLIAGLATLGSYGLICVVLQFEPVSAVVSLRQISVLLVVAWGCFQLKEPFGRKRLLAAGLIALGIGMIGWNGA